MERPLKTRSEMRRLVRKLQRRIVDLETALASRASCPVTTDPRPGSPREERAEEAKSCAERPAGSVEVSDPGLWQGLLATLPGLVWCVDRRGVVRACHGQEGPALERIPAVHRGSSFAESLGVLSGAGDLLRRTLAGEHPKGAGCFDASTGLALWCAPYGESPWDIAGAVGVCLDVADWQDPGMLASRKTEATTAVLWTQEQERRLLAYEIHDGFVQDATGALMHLETLLKTGRVPEGRAHQEVERALRLVRQAVAEARRVIGGLLPPVLEERGVVAALEYWIDEQSPDGPSIGLHVEAPWARWEPLLEGAVYRIVQEALTNVRRHSQSERAEVWLTQQGDLLHVEVRDWGIGFDPSGIAGERFGLRGIGERARLLGGRAEITSVPGQGTRVVVDLPRSQTLREVATT